MGLFGIIKRCFLRLALTLVLMKGVTMQAATITSGFDNLGGGAESFNGAGAELATQPGSNAYPWASAWVQDQGSSGKTLVYGYTDSNIASGAPTTTPSGGTPSGTDQLVQIENSSTQVGRNFQATSAGTLTASYGVFINQDLIDSAQPVEFALYLSAEDVSDGGASDFAAGVGVRSFGSGNNQTFEWGYFDGDTGKFEKFATTGSDSLETGWQSLTLTVDLDNSTYTATVVEAAGGNTLSVSSINLESSITQIQQVGFDRVSAGSGEYLFVDQLSVVGVAPEPATWLSGLALIVFALGPAYLARLKGSD